MKNVFKRCIKLIALFDSANKFNLDSYYIKDNISDYRNLSDSAFKRSFERDKSILKEIGFNLEYENDKWNLDEGYKMKGTNIIKELESKKDFNLEKFINSFSVVKKYLSPYFQINQELKIIPKINDSIRHKSRVSFIYKGNLRKVYPLGLRFHAGKWYLGAEDQKVVKTFKIQDIENLKIGNKSNLHEINVTEFSFSWEGLSKNICIELLSNKDLHRIHSNIFNKTEIISKDNGNYKTIKLKTNDYHGLIKYLLLVEPKILNISDQDKESLLEVVRGF